MCDTLCVVGNGRALFAKNSDRPPDEPQVVESFERRVVGGTLRTQYLEMRDAGASAVVGSRPTWLWGFEHGVNEHRVAIGNEAVYTTVAATEQPDGLIGMDLVRLGLERGSTAREAVEVMTALLERYGQSGSCYQQGGNYHSSFLIADPTEIWVLETAGKTWAAKRSSVAAISNRISLTDDWDAASGNVTSGRSFDDWRDPDNGTSFADVRLAASRACIAGGSMSLGPREMATHLRDHGSGGDGMPAKDEFTVCMHIHGASVTTAAMVCELPEDPTVPVRAWAALGSPCVSVFVPFDPAIGVPSVLGEESAWHRFATLRDRVEADPDALAEIRSVLRPLEEELDADPSADAGRLIEEGLDRLELGEG
ncbi:MAG: C69 family dipeptidase [Actinomycetota bacterium]